MGSFDERDGHDEKSETEKARLNDTFGLQILWLGES